MSEITRSSHPARASLVIRIGVTGHRPGRLYDADMDSLTACIQDVLRIIKKSVDMSYPSLHSYYKNTPPVMRVISPLAEGADRIVAHEALDIGCELQCPLPFRREEYENDFADVASKREFQELLNRATAVFEIDGSRAEENKAYQAVGNLLLNQCDVLIAVWDGEPSRGQGGTGNVIAEAVAQAIPVIWIDSRTPHTISLWNGEQESREYAWAEALNSQIYTLVQPPQYTDNSQVKSKTGQPRMLAALSRLCWMLNDFLTGKPVRQPGIIEYYIEGQGRISVFGWLYRMFRDVLSGEPIRRPNLTMPDIVQTTKQEWDNVWSKLSEKPAPVVEFLNSWFLLQYGWADKLADWNANQYRSSFVANYLLSGFAVLFALLAEVLTMGNSSAHDSAVNFDLLNFIGQNIYIVSEFVVITAIILITRRTIHSSYHKCWINYRFLAELFRSMRILAPLGLVTAFFRIPAYSIFDDVRNSWMNWHYRAVVREAGFPTVCIDSKYLMFCRNLLKHEVADQIQFHEINKGRYHRIGHWLHRFGVICFYLTLFVCLIHLIWHCSWLTLLSAVLPAFCAAAAGLLFQGEFERMELRAAAMQARLKEIDSELNKPRALSYHELCMIADNVAETMITEVLDWRTMFQTRPLRLP